LDPVANNYNKMLEKLLILTTIIIAHSITTENYTFYTKQNHSISLGKNVVDVDLESAICKFEPSSPSLILVNNVSVINRKSENSSDD
jgi:hypothetical protein